MATKEKEIYRNNIARCQHIIKAANLPVLVVLEGWGASGKGSVIASIIKYMDPRFFKVYNNDIKREEEFRYPFMHRFAKKIPEQGQFAFYDGSWMDEVTYQYLTNEIGEKEYEAKVNSILCFERQLRDNGYLVIKFFLDIDKQTQKERFDRLKGSSNTKWRVSDKDKWQHKHFKECDFVYHDYIKRTDTDACPWHIIKAADREQVESIIANTIVSRIDTELKNRWVPEILYNPFPMKGAGPLASVDPNCEITDIEYKKQLKLLQKKLKKLHNVVYKKRIPVIIAYEGWDAAGKGGNIKRVASALDPRGCEVFPIASPSPEEKHRHYLWRFWNRLPKTGHIAIFDRTWYGRVMVERIEGFCSENDWQRAYNEINEFEKDLTDWGCIIIKFWVHIDKDTQLLRFTDRQNDPEKQWKITDEDWRNREKWDQYEEAIDEMLAKTSTLAAPWHILESNNKKYARIKALSIIVDEIEKRI